MRKFNGGQQSIWVGLLLVTFLVSLAAFYSTGALVGYRTVLVVIVVVGLLLALSWAFARVRRKGEKPLLLYRVLRDPLTGLPNRPVFMERTEHALRRAAHEREAVAVLIVDLDDFEEINHGLGYEAGDRLLAVAGDRLEALVGREDTIARLYGDEFAVLLEGVSDTSVAVSMAKQIGEALKVPMESDGSEVIITASVGVAVSSFQSDNPEGLLRNADVAMHEAKSRGKARYRVFDPSGGTTTSGRLLLEAEMRRAAKEEEFRVYYQPLVTLHTGELRGMEALVRWQHPTYGLIPPAEFIPLAEQTGLIVPIGRWVLREACRQVRLWQKEHPRKSPLMLSVNVSACQFRQPSLVEEVLRALEETGLDPTCLKLEITESVMMHDASASAALHKLKDYGIELAMDDFGTGYSNLSYLKRLPIDSLKIDRSYVGGLSSDAEDAAIVHATVAFAKALNLNVTAEGIENAEQLALLRELGCELGQGYHFAKPLPSEEAAKLLEAGLGW